MTILLMIPGLILVIQPPFIFPEVRQIIPCPSSPSYWPCSRWSCLTATRTCSSSPPSCSSSARSFTAMFPWLRGTSAKSPSVVWTPAERSSLLSRASSLFTLVTSTSTPRRWVRNSNWSSSVYVSVFVQIIHVFDRLQQRHKSHSRHPSPQIWEGWASLHRGQILGHLHRHRVSDYLLPGDPQHSLHRGSGAGHPGCAGAGSKEAESEVTNIYRQRERI